MIPLYRGLCYLIDEDVDLLNDTISYPTNELIDKTIQIIHHVERIQPNLGEFKYSSMNLGIVYATVLKYLIYTKYKFCFRHQKHVAEFYKKHLNIWTKQWNFNSQIDFFIVIHMTGILARFFLYTNENPDKFCDKFLHVWFDFAARLMSYTITGDYLKLPFENSNTFHISDVLN